MNRCIPLVTRSVPNPIEFLSNNEIRLEALVIVRLDYARGESLEVCMAKRLD